MATVTLRLLPLFLAALSSATAELSPAEFLDAICVTTTFPATCLNSLSEFATALQKEPEQLARTTLVVSLASAESTQANVLKLPQIRGLQPKEYGALKDCLDELDDGVDHLSQAVREVATLFEAQGDDFLWHKNNLETWTTAALMGLDTCIEGFARLDGRVKSSVEAEVVNLEQQISNALSETIHRYQRHRKDVSDNRLVEENMQHLKLEAADMVKKIELLEVAKRNLLGEGLGSCTVEELQQIEQQLERSVSTIRARKMQVFMEQIEQLKEKEKNLGAENSILHKKYGLLPQQESNEDGEIVPCTESNESSDVETELFIGLPDWRTKRTQHK